MRALARYWHTLRYLRPLQVYGRLWFKLYPSPPPRPAGPLAGYGGAGPAGSKVFLELSAEALSKALQSGVLLEVHCEQDD